MKNKIIPRHTDGGQAMIMAVLFFLFISLSVILGLVSPVTREFSISRNGHYSLQGYYAAESGVEDAYYRLKTGRQLSATETLVLGDAESVTAISSTGLTAKLIEAQGDMRNRQRSLSVELTTGTGASFHYGIQVGEGGFDLSGGSIVYGNVYSNGSIEATDGVTITGSAVAANGSLIGGGNYAGAVMIGEDAWADTVQGADVAGSLYCQEGSDNNKPCDASRGDPSPAEFPISDETIIGWKEAAEAGGIHAGDLAVGHQGLSVGPLKVDGDLTVGGGGILTLTGTIWVTGDITLSGGGAVQLAASYGEDSGLLLADGRIDLSGGRQIEGSGEEGSYVMVLTTSGCPDSSGCNGKSAIKVNGGAGAVILNAQNGTMSLSGGAALREATANRITATGGTTITYEAGLSNPNFISGPGGTWNVRSWTEVE